MIERLSLPPRYRKMVEELLREHVPDAEVWAYGSRINGRSHEGSDLDLVVRGPGLEPLGIAYGELTEAFRESNIPILVQTHDWARLPKKFHDAIKQDYVVVQEPSARTAWREVAVGEIADIVGGGTPSTKVPENFDGDIPWLTPKDLSGIHDRYIERGERHLSQRGLDSSSAKLLPAGSVLLSTRAPIGYVALAKNPISTNQGFRSLVVRDGVVPEYLYYWLKLNTAELERHASGSTFRELSGSSLKEILLSLPPLEEQRAIARVLGALDDKIELNRRMSETLEEMARALFRSWFVDFDPVRAKAEGRPSGLPPDLDALFPASFEASELGEIPAGWEVKALGDVIEVNPKRRIRRGDVATHVEMAALPTSGPHVAAWTQRAFTSGSRFMRGDTLLARITPSLENGKTAFVDFLEEGETAWGSTEFIVLRPKEPWPPEIAYVMAREPAFREHAIVNMTGTSGRQRVPAEAVAAYAVTTPPSAVAVAFGDLVRPWFERSTHMSRQSHALAEQRDALLPRLVSGALRVAAYRGAT